MFYAFLSQLMPYLQEHVATHVQGDLEAMMAMAYRLEVYCGGDRTKAKGENKGFRKLEKQNKKGTIAMVQGNVAEETI